MLASQRTPFDTPIKQDGASVSKQVGVSVAAPSREIDTTGRPDRQKPVATPLDAEALFVPGSYAIAHSLIQEYVRRYDQMHARSIGRSTSRDYGALFSVTGAAALFFLWIIPSVLLKGRKI